MDAGRLESNGKLLNVNLPRDNKQYTSAGVDCDVLYKAMQVPVGPDQGFVPSPPGPLSEDCLYLNLWIPRYRSASGRLTTMFWLHGGAFTFGSSTEKIYNGASLAASECVIVASTNYRHAGDLLMHSCGHGADFRRCNILTGSNKDEGTFAISLLRPATYNFRSQQPLVNLTDQELQDTLTQLLSLTFKPEFIPGILAAVRDLYNYTSLQQAAPNPSFSLLKSVATDMVHSCPARLLATFYANRTQNAYLYSFEHTRDNTTFPDWVGATYVSEVPLVFGTITPDWPAFSPREVKLKQAIMHFWANFAKYGNPTTYPWDTPRWPIYSPPDPASILRFTQCTAVRVGRTERKPCDYWNSLPREYYKP